MTLRLHAAWQLAIVTGSAIGVFVYALNPTDIAVAAIVSFPGTVTAILATLAFFNNRAKERRDNERRAVDDERHAVTMGVLSEVKKATDGMMSAKVAEVAQLTTEKKTQAAELSETAQQLARVEGHEAGRQDGVASEINRQPPETKE